MKINIQKINIRKLNHPKDFCSLLKLACLFIFIALIGCSSAEKKSDTPEGAWEIAKEFDKDERYEEAIQRYNEVKNKFPYSRFATESELAIADVYFKRESYPEAQAAYSVFKEMHPKHPRTDYVIFRIGMSYFHQLPETPDRDLSLAKNALAAFDDLLTLFPTSEHAAEAKAKHKHASTLLAEREYLIGDYYFTRNQFDSALPRFEKVLSSYPGLGVDSRALSRAAIAASKNGQTEKSKKYYSRLQNEFANAPETQQTKRELEK